MAIQTLNTIKNWFKTSLKPSQQQFWDTWDSFRHKLEKVPVKDIEGIDELLNVKADKTVLNDHLSDINAHAPQVNTDWNSQSGFSQLLNKPEFKTINGESILGDGDIIIKEGELQNLDQVLMEGNTSSQGLQFYAGGTDVESSSVIHTINPYFNIIENKSVQVKNTLYANAMKIESNGGGTGNKTTASYQSDAIGFSTDSSGVRINFPRLERSLPTYLPLSVNGEFADMAGNIDISKAENLQSVLNSGNTATYSDGSSINLGIGDTEDRIANFYIRNTNGYGMSGANTAGAYMNSGNTDGSETAYINVNYNETTGSKINLNVTDSTSNIKFIIPNPNGQNQEYKLPQKNAGNYTLATLDDITLGGSQNLQRVTTEGNSTTNHLFLNLGASGTFQQDNKISSFRLGNFHTDNTGTVEPYYFFSAENQIANMSNQMAIGLDVGVQMSSINGPSISALNLNAGNTSLSTQNFFFKSSSANIFSIKLMTDNLTDSYKTIQIPNASGTIPISVNGYFADSSGNIEISLPTPAIPSLQEVLDQGGFALKGDLLGTYSSIQISPFSAILGSSDSDSYSGMALINGKGHFQQRDATTNYQTDLKFADPISTTNLILPAKAIEGEYTLATTADLPLMITASTPPSSTTATGTKGEIRIDDNYIYTCVATNNWKRSPLSSW